MNLAFERLQKKYGDAVIRLNEPMSAHTSFKIGGPMELMAIPTDVVMLEEILREVKAAGCPLLVMGNGSNLLVPDKGLKGAVIKVNEGFKALKVMGDVIHAEAGCLLSSISAFALDNSLEGFEFASGIPGTLGGAVSMNAGAYGGEMSHVVKSVTVMTKTGNIRILELGEMDFGYRHSVVQSDELIVLSAELQLKTGSPETIRLTLADLTEKRTSKQPLELPSAGSVFKRPEGHFAGKLIEDAGLKGLRYGNAQVSPKHCGFIVNLGNSNYEEVTTLIKTVQKIVLDTFGVVLETEIKIL